eukprot:363985-Chlamydomonas_euryale.AAC.1
MITLPDASPSHLPLRSEPPNQPTSEQRNRHQQATADCAPPPPPMMLPHGLDMKQLSSQQPTNRQPLSVLPLPLPLTPPFWITIATCRTPVGRLLHLEHAPLDTLHLVNRRLQVMIPDVQKLTNQSGYVFFDIFNTRLMKPPTSLLVFPLKVRHGVYGVIFCMSPLQTDFTDMSLRLKELCEMMTGQLLQTLTGGGLKEDYSHIRQ